MRIIITKDEKEKKINNYLTSMELYLVIIIFFLSSFEFIDNSNDWMSLECLHVMQHLQRIG